MLFSFSLSAQSWGTPKKDRCIGSGRATYSARLANDAGKGWENAAKTTSIIINDKNQGTPKRTSNQGLGGMWGEWDIDDNSCLPIWGAAKKDGCKGMGIVQYSARLSSDAGLGWEAAAKSTSIVINDVNQGPPKRTNNQGVGGMWGEWDVPDNSCKANWGDIADKGCTKVGYKTYSARLWNIPPGQDWADACNSTPATIKDVSIAKPTRCENKGSGGIWGEWDVPDNSCKANWSGTTDLGCSETKPGYKVYKAQLLNVPPGQDWVDACNATPFYSIFDGAILPSRCENRGAGGMWGEWDVPDNSCKLRWSGTTDLGCSETKPGFKVYEAQLLSIPPGQDWGDACNSTPATINGEFFSTPTRCLNKGTRGMWGEWDVPDNSCEPTPIEPYYYYKMQVKERNLYKAASTGYLRINSIGQAEISYDKGNDDFYWWLFVPTGVPGEYWIFNKGAQGGSGELLTYPQGYSALGQWELIEEEKNDDYEPNDDENRQKFTPEVVGKYYKLKLRFKEKYGSDNFVEAPTYGPATLAKDRNSDNQKFDLIKGDTASCDDILISSMFWNNSNVNVQNHVRNLCKEEGVSEVPGPKVLKLKKLVFINNEGGHNEVKIFKFGCRPENIIYDDGLKSECATYAFDTKTYVSYKVTNELRNSEEIWAVVGEALFWTANVVLTGATLGASTPFTIGLTTIGVTANSIKAIAEAGNAENDAKLITLGANHLGSTTYAVVDAAPDLLPAGVSVAGNIVILGLGAVPIIEQGMAISDGGIPITQEMFLNEFGLTENITPELKKYIRERYLMAVKGAAYKELMKEWKFTKNGVESYDKMYFGGGAAYFFNN